MVNKLTKADMQKNKKLMIACWSKSISNV